MRSIERRFKDIEEKNPYWSSYLCFAETIEGQGFSRRAIQGGFDKLVDKDDYAISDKRELVDSLADFSNDREDDIKQGVKRP